MNCGDIYSKDLLLCDIKNKQYELFNSKQNYKVDKTTFIHYLNYKRMLKKTQLLEFINNPQHYIKHNIIYINNDHTDLKKKNIHIDFNYEKKYLLDINIEDNYGIIILDNNTKILTDIQIVLDFKNTMKVFNYDKTKLKYPYYINNAQKIDLLEYIIGIRKEKICIEFNNKNIYDLRKKNINFYHSHHSIIIDKYPNAYYIPGHYKDNGKDAYNMKNPIWKIKENNKEYLLMYCETNIICKLCPISYQKILDFEKENNNNNKITFFIHQHGYIGSSINLYIHQIITNCYSNGKGTKYISVDHIDQDPLNNTFENLRIATRKEQEQNSKGIKIDTKRNRKYNAKPLPEGLTQDMMPKYVGYYSECYNKEKQLYRDFFKIEKHPKIDKPINSSKSGKLTIQEKLAEIKKIYENIENDIVEEEDPDKLPKYFRLSNARNAPHLHYESRQDNIRYNMHMKLKADADIKTELVRFQEKLQEKYPSLSF